MINLTIRGRSASLKKKEVERVIHWMSSKMKIDRYKIPIDIELQFKKNLKKRCGYKGSAIWEDTNHRPKEFTVEIDSGLPRYMTVRTILHELVHVKQYAKGQLKDFLKFYSLKQWKSRRVNADKLRYRDYPWEKEAYRLENVYYKKYMAEVYNKKHRKG